MKFNPKAKLKTNQIVDWRNRKYLKTNVPAVMASESERINQALAGKIK